jgi:hypothetical protein
MDISESLSNVILIGAKRSEESMSNVILNGAKRSEESMTILLRECGVVDPSLRSG